MGIHQSDLKIRSAIVLGLEDIKNNPWLINYILEDVTKDPFLKEQYSSQIKACKEWLKNNEIEVYMRHRLDKDRLPCITITLGNSPERDEEKTMADATTCTQILMPNEIGKPIPFVMKPFTPTSYDPVTGKMSIDPLTQGFDHVSVGMLLIDPENGEGTKILAIGPDFIEVEPNVYFQGSEFAIVPQYPYYVARMESTRFQETYNIGLHVHGDTQVLLWLHSIVMYSLLRYRETMLEGRGFNQSSLSVSDIVENPNYSGPGGEMAFSRFITLTGLVEHSWLKAPHRIIENIKLAEKKPKDDCCEEDGYKGGIKILSNNRPNIAEDDTWYPIEDTAEFDDEI